jgi:putative membrane protein
MIQDKDYERYTQAMILRDRLAMDRTVMANERTFLAFTRTALSIVVVGASFIKFLNSTLFHVLGWILIPLGIMLFGFGFKRYIHVRNVLLGVVHREEKPEEQTENTTAKSEAPPSQNNLPQK